MQIYQHSYNGYQLRLLVDTDKKFIQLNVVNPANAGHSVASTYKIDDETPIVTQEQVIAVLEEQYQLNTVINNAAKIFENLPANSE